MKNCTETQMGQICTTCGNIGFAEQLVTCYECKKSSDHIYCMRDRLLKVPTVWYCEECLGAPVDHTETEKTSKSQKVVIGTEKSNGLLERSPPLKSSEVTRHVSDHEQQSWANKSVSTILNTKVKSTACANSEALFRQGDTMSSPVSNISNSPSSVQFLYQKKMGPADADVHSPSKYIKRMSEVGNEKAETPEKAKASGCAFHSNSEFIRTGFPETNMPTLVNHYEELLHCHSPQVSWKGTFEIFDVASHLYKKMRAHLPTAICPKVYESLKKLPETLKFKLSSREDIWPKIFRLEPPTKNDIGLYFFPSELGRPKDKYHRLLERLNSRNLAMVTCMNDVQLLLFTSDELPLGSQRIDAEIYLWGLFRHVKHRKPICKIKVESPSYDSPMDSRDNDCAELNLPSRCSFEEVAMEVDMVGGKDVGRIDIPIRRPTLPHCLLETNAKCLNYVERSLVQFSCEKLASPNILDIPPGFSKLKPPIFSEELGSKYQSGSLESTFKGCTHSREDIPEENTYTSDRSPETNARDLNCEERLSVQFSSAKKVKAGPILPVVPPCLSKVVPQDDLMLLSSKHINLSLDSTSKSCIPSSIKLPIQRTCTSNGSTEASATDLNCVQRPLVKFSLEKLISPIRPEVPKCFLKVKPSGSSELLTSIHRGTSLESTSNVSRPSKLHSGYNPSSCMEGVASAPNTPDMQSKHHKEQSPGYQNISPMHIKSSHSSASAKTKKEVTVFSPPVRDTKLHAGSKNLPSPYAEKVNNLSENLSQERFFISNKDSEKRGHTNFLERSSRSGNIPQRDVKVHSMNKNIGPKESTEQEFKRADRDNMINEEDEGKKGTVPQSRMSWVQQCEPNPEECMENKKREREGTLYLTNKKGRCSPLENSQSPLPEARRWAGLVRESKNAVADELVSKKDIGQIGKEKQSKLDSENKTVCSVSALHSSPSNILELPKHGMQGQKRIVSYKLVTDGDAEVEEKMKSQRELDSEAKHSSLVGDLYNSPSTIPELPKDGIQRKKIMVSYKPVSDGDREVTKKKSPRELDSENKTVCSVSALNSSPSNILELPKHGPQEQKRTVSYKLVMDGDKEVTEKMKSKRELDSEAKHSSLVVDPYNSLSTIPELSKDGFQRQKRVVSYKLVMDGDTELVDKMKSQRELDSENKQSSRVADLYNSPSSNYTQIPLVTDFYSPSSGNCLSQIPLVANFYSPSSGNCLSVNDIPSSNPELPISSAKQDGKEGKVESGRMVFEERADKEDMEDIRGHNMMDTEKRQMGSILDDHSNPTCSGQPSTSSATPVLPLFAHQL